MSAPTGIGQGSQLGNLKASRAAPLGTGVVQLVPAGQAGPAGGGRAPHPLTPPLLVRAGPSPALCGRDVEDSGFQKPWVARKGVIKRAVPVVYSGGQAALRLILKIVAKPGKSATPAQPE